MEVPRRIEGGQLVPIMAEDMGDAEAENMLAGAASLVTCFPEPGDHFQFERVMAAGKAAGPAAPGEAAPDIEERTDEEGVVEDDDTCGALKALWHQDGIGAVHDPGGLANSRIMKGGEFAIGTLLPIGMGQVAKLIEMDRGNAKFSTQRFGQGRLAGIGGAEHHDARPQST